MLGLGGRSGRGGRLRKEINLYDEKSPTLSVVALANGAMEPDSESRIREIRSSGLMRGRSVTVIGLAPFNPSIPAYSTSFNIYNRSLDPDTWAFTSTLGKPCVIGEFHFGALDRGMFHPGLVRTRDQADRGRAYQEYLRSVLALPAFVGCHWFQVLRRTSDRAF